MKKKTDDESIRHPFYSDYGRKQFEKRKRALEQAEKDFGKRRKVTNGENI